MHVLRMFAVLAGLLVTQEGALARPLVIGAISGSPVEEIGVFQPLVQYLAQRLGEFGIERGKVTVVRSIPEMAEIMKSGGVDLMFDSPYPTLAVSRASGSKIILRRWKGGKSGYRSLILVGADSPMRTPKDLTGKVIAFEDPYSTSGYFLPASSLSQLGLRLRELRDPKAQVKPGEVGYVFTGKQENTLLWLLRGRTDAAAVGEHDFEGFNKAETAKMRIVLQTAYVPRHLVSVRRDLAPALASRIRELLIATEQSEEGRKLLVALEKTTRFDPLPPDAEQVLEAMRRLLSDSGAAAR